MDITPKNIVITGTTQGLGEALALDFSKLGHRVWGSGRSQKKSLEARGIRQSTVDVSNDRDVERWAAEVFRQTDHVDLLIHNASVMLPPSNLWEVSAEDFDRIIQINLHGTAHMIRHFVPKMLSAQVGIFVTVISGSAKRLVKTSGPYNASKWGAEALTLTLAKQLPVNMAAVAVAPGTTNTAMLRTIIGDGAEKYPTVDEWVIRAVPFLLHLTPANNGDSLAIPGPLE